MIVKLVYRNMLFMWVVVFFDAIQKRPAKQSTHIRAFTLFRVVHRSYLVATKRDTTGLKAIIADCLSSTDTWPQVSEGVFLKPRGPVTASSTAYVAVTICWKYTKKKIIKLILKLLFVQI